MENLYNNEFPLNTDTSVKIKTINTNADTTIVMEFVNRYWNCKKGKLMCVLEECIASFGFADRRKQYLFFLNKGLFTFWYQEYNFSLGDKADGMGEFWMCIAMCGNQNTYFDKFYSLPTVCEYII